MRVLPGDPASNRPLGREGGAIFYAVSLFADAFLLGLLLLLHGRSRRWRMDVAGASSVARGRVQDVRRGRLRLDSGFVLSVEVGPHRNRADYRDHAEVPGTLTLRSR